MHLPDKPDGPSWTTCFTLEDSFIVFVLTLNEDINVTIYVM